MSIPQAGIWIPVLVESTAYPVCIRLRKLVRSKCYQPTTGPCTARTVGLADDVPAKKLNKYVWKFKTISRLPEPD
jgi:hypothetical protein